MYKIIGLVLLVVGVYLLIRGHDISRSVNSQFKDLFTGSPSAKVTYYYLGGAICGAVGLVGLLRNKK